MSSMETRDRPAEITEWIRVDQFGYLPDAPKVAIASKPAIGFNAPGEYEPGETFHLVRTDTGAIVWSGAPERWNYGMMHDQSGDRGWWIDFSEVTDPGEYYLLDVAQNLRSYPIRIGDRVYDEVLLAAVRTYFYQRLNQRKEPPFVDPAWADDSWYDGPGQDREATSRYAKGDESTARDLHGGWMDAGDPNKYTTFAEFVVIGLLQTYEARPDLFGDDTNIPESGNGLPDLLDEVRYELEFLGRMQDATGTGGLFLKVGVDNHNAVVPLSQDRRPRYYLPECTSATLAGAGMFAMGALVYREHPQTAGFGAELLERAIAAWNRGEVTTESFTTFQTDCDDQDITSGDADRDGTAQLESAVAAAVFLFEATGDNRYRDFVDRMVERVRPVRDNWWGPYSRGIARALLRYADLTDATPEVRERIRSSKAKMSGIFSVPDYERRTDLYRAYMDNSSYNWGSNSVRSNVGALNLEFVEHGINEEYHEAYREIALEHLHWLHGANPLGRVMLSNMYEYGAALSVNEFYHTWYGDGTDWDNVTESKYGPPPGYLVGGPNKFFTGEGVSPPAGQPPQKSYLDWNGGWPENSWEVTENAIYYQSAYIELLARLIPPRR